MKTRHTGFHSILANEINRFLDHKRALGRRFDVEEKTLRLLDRFLADHAIRTPESVSSGHGKTS